MAHKLGATCWRFVKKICADFFFLPQTLLPSCTCLSYFSFLIDLSIWPVSIHNFSCYKLWEFCSVQWSKCQNISDILFIHKFTYTDKNGLPDDHKHVYRKVSLANSFGSAKVGKKTYMKIFLWLEQQVKV